MSISGLKAGKRKVLKDLFLPALTVGISELGDKTQLAVLSLSSRQKSKVTLFAAVMAAFLIVDGLAVLFGAAAAELIPFRIIRIAAGIVFVAYGAYTIIMSDSENRKKEGKATFLSVMGLMLLLEMGDKSQIATMLFAAQYNPFLVFLGVEAALALLTLAAILIGAHLKKVFSADSIRYVSGAIFIAVGVISLL